MKLYRFKAENTQSAMFNVTQALGYDAMIYSTRATPDGVEILAGYPLDINQDTLNSKSKKTSKKSNQEDVAIQDVKLDNKVLETIKRQVELLNEDIKKISEHISHKEPSLLERLIDKNVYYWHSIRNLDFTKLLKIG